MTNAELLQEAKRGDAEAWRRLYSRCLPVVWRFAFATVNDVHAAEDVASETMLALVQNIDHVEPDAFEIFGWLRTVVHSKAADHFRKVFRLRDKLAKAAESRSGITIRDDATSCLELEETRQRIGKILGAIPSRQRLILELKYLDDLSVRDIAERLGDTEKAIEATLYRARGEFRRIYESEAFCGSKGACQPVDIVARRSSLQDQV